MRPLVFLRPHFCQPPQYRLRPEMDWPSEDYSQVYTDTFSPPLADAGVYLLGEPTPRGGGRRGAAAGARPRRAAGAPSHRRRHREEEPRRHRFYYTTSDDEEEENESDEEYEDDSTWRRSPRERPRERPCERPRERPREVEPRHGIRRHHETWAGAAWLRPRRRSGDRHHVSWSRRYGGEEEPPRGEGTSLPKEYFTEHAERAPRGHSAELNLQYLKVFLLIIIVILLALTLVAAGQIVQSLKFAASPIEAPGTAKA